jgi:hypothetical protein
MARVHTGRMVSIIGAGLLAAIAVFYAADAPAAEWRTGGLTFSDELGGFRLLSASGVSTVENPIVIVEEIFGDGPATLDRARGAGKDRRGRHDRLPRQHPVGGHQGGLELDPQKVGQFGHRTSGEARSPQFLW